MRTGPLVGVVLAATVAVGPWLAADRFQDHVMRFFSRTLCPQEGCR